MYDQSFNLNSLARELRKSDFIDDKRLRNPTYKEKQIARAVERAEAGFEGYDLLAKSTQKGKSVYFINDFSDELVLRKVCKNILKVFPISYPNRDLLVSNIRNLISEGVAYRIYRLDLKSFYESISVELAKNSICESNRLSIPTKRFVTDILDQHCSCSYPGLPRGLGLSALLSELVMLPFDNIVKKLAGVYYYGRFVDDIIIITNRLEDEKSFLENVRISLPPGLVLNKNKQIIQTAKINVAPYKLPAIPNTVISFDFLGYKFTVYEPLSDGGPKGGHFRDVRIDIADSKLKKIKTRIIRSLIAFNNDKDYSQLEQRLKYLTSNFSVTDPERQQKRLAGIYHNYWLVDQEKSFVLPQLDYFLRKAIISGTGSIFDEFFSKSTDTQRRMLLRNSFVKGFGNKTYLHFSKESLANIQRCWIYA
jgi:hypothetical protein